MSDLNNLNCNLISQHNNKILLNCYTKNNDKQITNIKKYIIKNYSPSEIPPKLKLVPSPVYGMI